MLDNLLGIAGIILAMVPIGLSSLRTTRLQALVAAHDTASSILTEERVRRAYRRYVEDLSYELVTRTAVSFGRSLAIGWVVLTGVLMWSSVRNAAAGAASVDDISHGEALAFVFSDLRLLSNLFVATVALTGLYNCVWQCRLSYARALYLHAVAPGTQAFKRFIRSAKVYALLVVLPGICIPIAYLFGVDVVRREIDAGAAGYFPSWLVALLIFGGGCFGWYELYFPVSTAFGNIRFLRESQADRLRSKNDLAPFVDPSNTYVESFLTALQAPRIDLLQEGQAPSRPE